MTLDLRFFRLLIGLSALTYSVVAPAAAPEESCTSALECTDGDCVMDGCVCARPTDSTMKCLRKLELGDGCHKDEQCVLGECAENLGCGCIPREGEPVTQDPTFGECVAIESVDNEPPDGGGSCTVSSGHDRSVGVAALLCALAVMTRRRARHASSLDAPDASRRTRPASPTRRDA